MIISFTGTRQGMTKYQIDTFNSLMYDMGMQTLIHGDCVGADADAHVLAMLQQIRVLKRPCNIERHRAFTDGGEVVAEPEPPLIRNRKIVNDGEQLIACPATHEEELRSGTWATIRYAKKNHKPVTIIWPDGTTSLLL